MSVVTARRPAPNPYTECEVYRGYTISILAGSYYIHDAEGFLSACPAAASRAEARRMIRERLPDGG